MFKRAVLSVKRRKTKTVILFLFLFIIANLVLSAIAIKNATKESMKVARQSLGGTVTLSMDMEKLRKQFMPSGNETPPSSDSTNQSDSSSTDAKTNMDNMHNAMDQSTATMNDVKKIASLKYVSDVKYTMKVEGTQKSFSLYSASSTTSNTETNDDRPQMKDNNNLQIEAINTFKLEDSYVSGTIKLVSGKAFEENDDDTVIISYELATANSLSVGDSITLTDSSSNEHTLKIIGIYQSSDKSGFGNNYNKIYVNINTGAKFLSSSDYNNGNFKISSAVFYLKDPKDADLFIKAAKKKVTDLSSRNLTLDIDTDAYKQMVSSIEGVSKFSNILLIIVSAASVVVISLMIVNSLKDRNYELGVLLSMGEKRKKIVGQFIIEVFIIATASFILSVASSMLISQKLANVVLENQTKTVQTMQNSNQGGRGNGFDKGSMSFSKSSTKVKTITSLDVNVNAKDIGLLFVVGYGIIIISMIIPSIKILHSDPKDILSRRE